ncbi:MAG: J domain-containing protein [Candidatus Wallbacteria bacterium]|nr:J domain-containing protein [Candidatus Wallbacteria bacterium]
MSFFFLACIANFVSSTFNPAAQENNEYEVIYQNIDYLNGAIDFPALMGQLSPPDKAAAAMGINNILRHYYREIISENQAARRQIEVQIVRLIGLFTKKEKKKEKKKNPLDECYEILGCTRNDPVDIIKKRYRQKAKTNHPDVFIAKGLGNNSVKAASEKFRQINEAYEKVRKERKF